MLFSSQEFYPTQKKVFKLQLKTKALSNFKWTKSKEKSHIALLNPKIYSVLESLKKSITKSQLFVFFSTERNIRIRRIVEILKIIIKHTQNKTIK